MALLALSGTQLLGLGFAALGFLIAALTARYVWRATGIWRAAGIDALAAAGPGELVRFEGTVHRGSDEFLRAPFSGQECQVLRYTIEERHLSPFLLPWDVTLRETAGSVPFRVRTAADAIDLLGPSRSVLLEDRFIETVRADETPPDRIRRFEHEHDQQASASPWRSPPNLLQPIASALSLGTRRYVEQRAGSGDVVTVVGRVTERGDAVDPIVVSDRDPVATVLGMAKPSLVGFLAGVSGIVFGAILFVA